MNQISKQQITLIVLDGWGIRDVREHNALAEARTPFFDSLWEQYPHTALDASSLAVGLPEGQMGNSEIGHMTIGAGTVIDTDLVRISKAIRENKLVENPALDTLFKHIQTHDSTLHLVGLMSPGGVHSHSDHLIGLLEAAKAVGLQKVVIHAFTDGRDTPPQSAAIYLKELEDRLASIGIGYIATASGRFYAMDRDNNWDRLSKVEAALFTCTGTICQEKRPSATLAEFYQSGVLDEHLEPLVFLDEHGKSYAIEPHDGVLFFNFRADRARMLAHKIAERAKKDDLCFVTLTKYDDTLGALVAFPQQGVETTLAAEVARAGLLQAHIAETEKYAHATYFLNGGREQPHDGEEHVLIESHKDIKTHDQAPQMRAREITDTALERLERGVHFIFINYANADMVGHTANKPAIIEAAEEIDTQLARLVPRILERGGIVCITADHGNAETNIDPKTGERHTAHTANLVPFIITKPTIALRSGGTLADVAPTVLHVFGIEQPASMTGQNLIV
jgi:2,3-bisphosphoglycerate-independent phosphoglycerate mutase